MEDKEHYQLLVLRFQENSLSEKELEVFFYLLEKGNLDAYLSAAMMEAAGIDHVEPSLDALAEVTAMDTEEEDRDETAVEVPLSGLRRLRRFVAVAAVLVLSLAGGVIFWIVGHRAHSSGSVPSIVSKIIPPGGNKAILTLSDGANVVLDSSSGGLLAKQGNADIVNQGGEELSYHRSGASSGILSYNTVTTPRGGTYKVILSDGTKVWLNASSSLHFPAVFGGKDRTVMVTGEAYFEVVKDPGRPFVVSTASDLKVEVMGTSFNIMSYSDEPAQKATLIRGAVKVSNGESSQVLHPGDQANLFISDDPVKAGKPSIRLIHDADTTEAIAWTTGFFQFEQLDIRPLMRQIARWYDVEIVYDPAFAKLPARHFGGRIARNLNLTDVLHILEVNKIHFRVEASTIHVLP